MPSRPNHHLAHSERLRPARRRQQERLSPDENLRVTVVVRSRSSLEERREAVRNLAAQHPLRREQLTRERFTRKYGADPADLARVARFAEESGLEVVESSSARRCVVLSGTAASFNRAFGVRLVRLDHPEGRYRSYDGPVSIPHHLADIVRAVHGLDDRPQMLRHLHLSADRASRPIDPARVARAYSFPPRAKGRGQCVAIIELGGGFHRSDMIEFFRRRRMPVPKISVVGIDGQKNDPAPEPVLRELLEAMGLLSHSEFHHLADPGKGKKSPATPKPADLIHALWTIETTLDIQLVGALANAAHIVVYFAPNTAHGKYHALSTALNSRKYPPDVVSCSWGAPESKVDRDLVHSLDHLFEDAALRGVSICFSSGDDGDGSDTHGRPIVHFPASSPHVLACGGTHWLNSRDEISEVTWNEPLGTRTFASGGGISSVFERPEWQHSSGVEMKTGKSGRGVPDVAGKADIVGGYSMLVGKYEITMGGTSAASPMWASLIARLNEALGQPTGYITPFLYQDVCRPAIHDISRGHTGKVFHAGTGWDPCTGLGTPNGKRLLAVLRKGLAAKKRR